MKRSSSFKFFKKLYDWFKGMNPFVFFIKLIFLFLDNIFSLTWVDFDTSFSYCNMSVAGFYCRSYLCLYGCFFNPSPLFIAFTYFCFRHSSRSKQNSINLIKGYMKKCFHHEKIKYKRSFLKQVLLLLRPFY